MEIKEEILRDKPYKEDSTKGESLILPINYKGDMLTQAWIDSRIIATLAVWMEKSGYSPKSMSEVCRIPLEIMVESLVNKGAVELIDDTRIARDLLQKWFRVNLNRGGRGGKNVLHNQILTTERDELRNQLEQRSRQKAIGDSAIPLNRRTIDEGKMNELLNLFKQTAEPTKDESEVVNIPIEEANEEYLKHQEEIKKMVEEAKRR